MQKLHIEERKKNLIIMQVYLAQGQWMAVCGFYISCHPEKGLTAEDFPYPSLLPLAPGKRFLVVHLRHIQLPKVAGHTTCLELPSYLC